MAKSTYQSIKIFDLMLFSDQKSRLLSLLENHLLANNGLISLVTPNPEQIVLSRNNQQFFSHLQKADISIPDGVGLVIASKLFAATKDEPSLKERITGIEVVQDLIHLAAKEEWPVLIIGGRNYPTAASSREGQAKQLDTKLHQRAYWLEAYKDVSRPTKKEEAAVSQAITEIEPKIVFVALGAPHQEAWLVEHRALLEQNKVSLAMAVGGAFDMLLGKINRAPGWMQSLGLEWLYRLFQEPWRWRRQLKLLEFIKLTFQSI